MFFLAYFNSTLFFFIAVDFTKIVAFLTLAAEWPINILIPDFEQLFSYVLYLNDDFEGGNTLFMNQRLKVVPQKGSIICYLSDLQNIHKGAIIKSGFKRIILGGIGRH